MKKLTALLTIFLFTMFLFSTGTAANAKILGKNKQKPKDTKQKVIPQPKQQVKETIPEEITTPPVPFEGILSQSSFKISAIDPKAGVNFTGSFYPGGRGANQLVVYTPKMVKEQVQMNLELRQLL